MPVYNDVDFIEKSIKSILNQTFRDFELVISDDCSTDGSGELCKKYGVLDARIRYIRQETNIGISRNMEFLLSQADTDYFMWAGDDDLMDPAYVERLITALKGNMNAVSAFATMIHIDENDGSLGPACDYDYANRDLRKRIRNFITDAHDEFGYGLFRTASIREVRFPVWHWPNKKCAYNNIFPSLCYYLAKGDYVHVYDKPLFFKRVKTPANTHHLTTFSSNGVLESFAFYIRKWNLVCFTIKMLSKAKSILFALSFFPTLFWHWFVLPSNAQTVLLCKAAMRKVMRKNNNYKD